MPGVQGFKSHPPHFDGDPARASGGRELGLHPSPGVATAPAHDAPTPARPYTTELLMVVICSWCLRLLRISMGPYHVSHGICVACMNDCLGRRPKHDPYDALWVDLGGEG